VTDYLAESDAVGVIDETGFLKIPLANPRSAGRY
jgi:hypothetical protein